MPSTTYLLELLTPIQWRAGYSGADRKPFYFDCADCGAKEPFIGSFLSFTAAPDFKEIVLFRAPGDAFVKLALFCVPCTEKRLRTCTPIASEVPS